MSASAGLRAFQLGHRLADKLIMIGERIARALAAAVLGTIFGFMLSNEITGALGGAAIGVLLAEFTELPLLPQIETWRVQKAGREDAAGADPRIAMSFRDATRAAQEPAEPSRTTNVFVAAFSLTSWLRASGSASRARGSFCSRVIPSGGVSMKCCEAAPASS